jgi:hypothetical protein
MITINHHIDGLIAIKKATEEIKTIRSLHPHARVNLAIESDTTNTKSGWVAVTVNNHAWSYHVWPHLSV